MKKLLCIAAGYFLLSSLPIRSVAQWSPVEGNGAQFRQQQKEKDALRLFDQTGVPSQFIEIDPAKGATFIGRKGTKFTVPPFAFVTTSGQTVTEPVIFEYKDVAGKSEILLTNVPTRAGREILESGGVVYMDAKSEGETVKMAPDKTIDLEFQASRSKEGMQGFTGRYDANGNMDWTAMKNPLTADPTTLMFEDGEHGVEGYVFSILKKCTSCEGGDKLNVEVEFDPETGITNRISAVGINNRCYMQAIPGIVKDIVWKGKAAVPGKATFSVFVNFSRNDNETPCALTADPAFTHYDPEFMKVKNEKMSSVIASNTIRATGLGWVNWDCFATPPARQDIAVKVKGGEEKEFARVFVVYDYQTIVLDARHLEAGEYMIYDAPIGIPGHLIGISYLDGKPFLSALDANISGEAMTLALKPTTVPELKAKVAEYVD